MEHWDAKSLIVMFFSPMIIGFYSILYLGYIPGMIILLISLIMSNIIYEELGKQTISKPLQEIIDILKFIDKK